MLSSSRSSSHSSSHSSSRSSSHNSSHSSSHSSSPQLTLGSRTLVPRCRRLTLQVSPPYRVRTINLVCLEGLHFLGMLVQSNCIMVLNWCGGTLIWKNRPICFIFLGSWGSVPTRSTKTPTFKGIFSQSV